jgi:hypothetical protein
MEPFSARDEGGGILLTPSTAVTSPPLRSVLRQRLHETSTRSLEERIRIQQSGSFCHHSSDRLRAVSAHSEPDAWPLDGTDEEDDDDDDFFEDLDPDDAPELRRVRPSHSSAPDSLPRRPSSSRIPADLTAAQERFQQLSASLSQPDRPGRKRGVARVDAPAPTVKPPGRPRTRKIWIESERFNNHQ